MTPDEPEAFPIEYSNISETKRIIFYPNIKSTVTLFFVLVLYILLFGVVTGLVLIVLDNQHVKSRLLESLLSFLMYVVSLLGVIKYASRKSKESGYPEKINFNKIQVWLVPLIIIGTLALTIPLSETSAWIPMPKWVEKLFEKSFTTDIFSIVTTVIAAPILEEILCRGIILKGLLKNYSPIKAIIISALFFSLIHLNPWQSIPAFFSGLFLGWVYYKTQSVIPGMIIHATINTTATVFLFLPSNHQDLLAFWGTPVYLTTCLVSVAILAAVCFIIQKKASIIPEPII